MMTMQEVHAHLKAHLENESKDVAAYTEMAETAKAAGENELAFWLWQIAHDEQQHASMMLASLGATKSSWASATLRSTMSQTFPASIFLR